MQLPIVKTQADRWARGAAQPTINLNELNDFVIALVARHEKVKAIQGESLHQADHLFDTLLHQAFTV
jgi:hypothetical protein